MVKLADILEVNVAELLGGAIHDNGDRNEIAEQLSRINGQLAIKNRRARLIWRIALGIVLVFIVVNLFLLLIGVITNNTFEERTEMEQMQISETEENYEILS